MAKRASKSTKQAKPSPTLDIPVTFGRVSIGANNLTIPIKIGRHHTATQRKRQLQEFDQIFVGKRIEVQLVRGGADDADGQTTIVDDLHPTIDGAADVNRFGTNADNFSTSLAFSKHSVDLELAGEFACTDGRLIVKGVAEQPAEPEPADAQTVDSSFAE